MVHANNSSRLRISPEVSSFEINKGVPSMAYPAR